jgi:YbbR domain-containing protein
MQGSLNRLFNNCGLKLISLILAISLSIYVAYFSSNPVRYDIELELRPIGPAAGLVVNTADSRIPETIKVKLRGPYRTINNAQKQKLHASIDLADAHEGSRILYRVQLPELGDDLTVIDHNPKTVTLTIEKLAEKTLNIEIEKRGNVAEEFEISSEDISPSTVTVSGPDSIIAQVMRSVIEPIIEGTNDERRLDQTVNLYDGNDHKISTDALKVEPAAVSYIIKVIPSGSLRVLKVSPRIVGDVPDGFRLGTSNPNPLYVTAPAEDVPDGVYYVRTSQINVTDLIQTQVFSGLEIQYPFDLPVNSSLPLTCDVSVEVRPITEDERLVDIELINQQDDMDYNISPERLVVKSEELAELNDQEIASQIRAWIDVGSLEPGQKILRIPQVDLPPSLQHVSLPRLIVTVSINRKDAEK